jgi:alpha-L-rhamnosidase
MTPKFINEFKSPSNAYRGIPFWAWNGKLEHEELRRQIGVFKEMGLGGFFMHSRIGLTTQYLGEEWFECIKTCLDEAKKQGLKAWLYDEDRWPSGAAGGLVTVNPEYRQRMLIMEELDSLENYKVPNKLLGQFVGQYKNEECVSYHKVKMLPISLGLNEKLLVFYEKVSACDSWFNNQTYIDILNPDAVKKFIEVTHEKYRDAYGDKFGDLIPGIFTDEPQYNHCKGLFELENATESYWTKCLPNIFQKRYDYNLLEFLPEIFYNCSEKALRTRHNYLDTVAHLFATAFTKQIADWCEENNLMLTGHVMGEDLLSRQSGNAGSCMRSYEFMQMPGMDLLTEYSCVFDSAKQVSSAARQFGHKWRLTETYGCTGWDFNFAGHKALGDWQAALGINVRCQHLSWYTMEGEAKRDYPASISYQSSWCREYSKVEDYFGRINVVNSEGEEIRDLLVVQPLESMWLLMKKGWYGSEAIDVQDKDIMFYRDCLLKANIDFDYGEEDIIARHCKIENGVFAIGLAKYKAVLLPNMQTIRSSTLKLLKDFTNQGGKVIFAGGIPTLVDAMLSENAGDFAKQCICVGADETEIINSVEFARCVSITDDNGTEIPSTLYRLNETADSFILFVCNTSLDAEDFYDTEQSKEVKKRVTEWPEVNIELFRGYHGPVVELDPETGKIYQADCRENKVRTSLVKIGSRIFIFPKKHNTSNYPRRPDCKLTESKELPSQWQISLTENNVLTFDMPEYSFDNTSWYKQDNVLFVDNAVREKMGLELRGGSSTQPWAAEKKANVKKDVFLKYQFEVSTIPSGDLYLAAEALEFLTIWINGQKLDSETECGWWCDKSLRKLPVASDLIQYGVNEIIIKCCYTSEFSGLEAIFLLGNFGVKIKNNIPTLIPVVTTLNIGDWTKQGLPFYSDSVIYHTELEYSGDAFKALLRLPEFEGIMVKIIINDRTAGVIAWAPNELDISEHLSKGSNKIDIEVFGSRRNSHGPLHNKHKQEWVGPAQMKPAHKDWTAEYQLVTCGLIKAPIIELYNFL